MLVSTVAAGEGGITYQSWLGWTTDYFTNYYLYVDKDGTFASHPMLNGDSNLFTVKKNYLYVCGYQF